MTPEPTTAASSNAVPTLSAVARFVRQNRGVSDTFAATVASHDVIYTA